MMFILSLTDNEISMIVLAGLIGLLFSPVVIFVLVYGLQRFRLRRWCRVHGLRFYPKKRYDFFAQCQPFTALKRIRGQFVRNCMIGSWQKHTILFFECYYDSGGPARYFWAAMIQSDWVLDHLYIRDEKKMDKVADMLGFNDIDFESQEFSKRFFVAAKNRKWAYDVFHTRAMEFFLKHWCVESVEFLPGWMFVKIGGSFKLKLLEQAADLGTGLLDMIPEYVKERG